MIARAFVVAAAAASLLPLPSLGLACRSFRCMGATACIPEEGDGATCELAPACPATSIQFIDGDIQIADVGHCRVTLEDIHLALPEQVTKSGTVYTANARIWIRDKNILEIHGVDYASSTTAAVSLLRLKSDEDSAASIIAQPGKISIMGTTITSYDASLDGPDERLEGRAYIAALSSESEGQAFTSRMDVTDSEISYLGNEGDYHNDLDEDYGLVWKVLGFDDRYPGGDNVTLFDRLGVYGTLTNNKLHDNYMGAYCYGMKGSSSWSGNEVYDNYLNGLNPQDNSDGMTIFDNYVHDNGWHGIEYSKRCSGAVVYNNLVEDNARAGIFFHRSTDYAEAYGNTCRRNLEGDFGIVESTGVRVYDNVMEGGKYGIRLSLGAQDCIVEDNTMTDSSRYGVFFYRGSDDAQASESWDGRPRNNIIRYNTISDPAEGQGVAVTGSDNNEILDNTFAGIDRLRFVDAQNNLLQGNDLPNGVAITLEDATLAEGSQSGTD